MAAAGTPIPRRGAKKQAGSVTERFGKGRNNDKLINIHYRAIT